MVCSIATNSVIFIKFYYFYMMKYRPVCWVQKTRAFISSPWTLLWKTRCGQVSVQRGVAGLWFANTHINGQATRGNFTNVAIPQTQAYPARKVFLWPENNQVLSCEWQEPLQCVKTQLLPLQSLGTEQAPYWWPSQWYFLICWNIIKDKLLEGKKPQLFSLSTVS